MTVSDALKFPQVPQMDPGDAPGRVDDVTLSVFLWIKQNDDTPETQTQKCSFK